MAKRIFIGINFPSGSFEIIKRNGSIYRIANKSDIFRWYLLSTDGGFWSDMDILFIKPIEQYYNNCRDLDIVMSYFDGCFSIGFLGASAQNEWYKDILHIANGRLDKSISNSSHSYDTCGVFCVYDSIGGCTETKIDILQKTYPQYKIQCNHSDFVYPFKVKQMEYKKIFEQLVPMLPDVTVGIHWYGGSPLAQHYNNILNDKSVWTINNTFTFFARKIL